MYRNGIEVGEAKVTSLKREKDDARTVKAGFECGIGLEGVKDLAEGDIIAFFRKVEVARKLIKRIGLELAEDPEFKPWVIEPIKMQGVQEFGEYGIVLRMKVTTRPGGAFAMKRKFYLRVRQVFKDNNIELPVPTVHIQGHSAGMTPAALSEVETAAAQAHLAHQKKMATETETDS